MQTLAWVFENSDTQTLTPVPVTPVQVPGTLYCKLHIGDPGKDALDNPAANTVRMAVSVEQPVTNFDTNGQAHSITDLNIVWLNVPASETYSHVSFWDDETVGNAWYKGPMTAPVPVLIGGNFVFPSAQTFDHQ